MGGLREKITGNRVSLLGHTRALDMGVHSVQNSQNCRRRVWGTYRAHGNCRVGYDSCTEKRIRIRVCYQQYDHAPGKVMGGLQNSQNYGVGL